MSKQPQSRITAEETTTLPEGAVISVYRVGIGKLGHYSTRLVALHGKKRVEMTVDNISPQNLRQYLQLVRRDIERRRQEIIAKPELDPLAGGKPNDMNQFVFSMAFNDMFIFQALTDDNYNEETGHTKSTIDADSLKPTKKVVSRRRKIQKRSQVLPDSDGVMQRSGETAGDS